MSGFVIRRKRDGALIKPEELAQGPEGPRQLGLLLEGASPDYQLAPAIERDAEMSAWTMARLLNGSGGAWAEQFVATMAREHRTLQQLFTGLCLKWLYHLAAHPEHQDLRNQASVETATRVVAALGPYGATLPLI